MDALADHHKALRETAGIVDCSNRELIRVTGEDRVSFIHGMVTNDVTGLQENAWLYAALCTAKGAMVADARVLKLPNALLLDTEPGYGQKLIDHLNKFLISEDAELANATEERGVLLVAGPKSKDAVQAVFGGTLPEGTQVLTLPGDVLAIGHGLYGVPAYELFVPRGALPELKAKLEAHATAVSREALELLRVEAGLGRMGVDMEEGATIPLEANLERGISYNKGCYVGQETIARATFRGHVNKKLVGLQLSRADAAPNTPLKKGEKVVGRITSTAHSPKFGEIALGYVHRTLLDPGTELELEGGGTAKVTALPFS